MDGRTAVARTGHRALIALAAIVALTGPASLASQDTTAVAAPCLRFAFGAWDPPLNWDGAGHSGSADASGQAARRLRDSIFLLQPTASPRDGMVWDESSRGTRLFLFPAWWPAGVIIRFDSTLQVGDTLRGMAEAMVADGFVRRSTTRVRALRVRCGGSR